jgi:hypothetical protein
MFSACLPRPSKCFVFCCVRGCEKLSEIVMSFQRTISRDFGQAALLVGEKTVPVASDPWSSQKQKDYDKANKDHD